MEMMFCFAIVRGYCGRGEKNRCELKTTLTKANTKKSSSLRNVQVLNLVFIQVYAKRKVGARKCFVLQSRMSPLWSLAVFASRTMICDKIPVNNSVIKSKWRRLTQIINLLLGTVKSHMVLEVLRYKQQHGPVTRSCQLRSVGRQIVVRVNLDLFHLLTKLLLIESSLFAGPMIYVARRDQSKYDAFVVSLIVTGRLILNGNYFASHKVIKRGATTIRCGEDLIYVLLVLLLFVTSK